MNDKLNKLSALSQEVMREAASKYHYSVVWSEEDCVYIGTVAEWPSLSAHADTKQGALEEILAVVCRCLYAGAMPSDDQA